MTHSGDNRTPKFTIRRLDPDEPSPSQSQPTSNPTPPERPVADTPTQKPKRPRKKTTQPTSAAPTTPTTPINRTGIQFRSASSLIAFLGAILRSELINEADVRRSPTGIWWVEVDRASDRLTPLIWTAGGRPFAPRQNQWVALSLAGELPQADETPTILNVADWQTVDLAELLASTNLLTSRYLGATILDVVMPGSLGRWILRRAANLGLDTQIYSVRLTPLGRSDAASTNGLRLRLRSATGQPIPAALVHSLTSLPYTIVAEPTELEGSDLLVDVRHRLTLPTRLVLSMIPTGESWVMGPPDVGYWRMESSTAVDGAMFLGSPNLAIETIPAQPTIETINPISVRLTPRSGRRQADAVLLDDEELAWLKPLLMGRAIGEVSFLLLGSGRHLLTAPGGLPNAVPFGVPVSWVGPGSLYVELGQDFYPPLPDGARQTRFQLDPTTVVVVVQNAAYRFVTAQIVPTWTLWVGEPPQIQAGLSPQSEQLLAQVSPAIRQNAAQSIASPRPLDIKPVKRSEIPRLLEQAQQLELAGNLIAAAELLEKAGYPGQAGRLYERAARNRSGGRN